MNSNLSCEPVRRESGPCFREPVRAAGPGAPFPAQDQSTSALRAPQGAPLELTHLEATCSRMLREWGELRLRVKELEARDREQAAALDNERQRRRHAELMQSAVELRLDDLADRHEESLEALELLHEAISTPQSDEAYESALRHAMDQAAAVIEKYQPEVPE